MPQKMAFTEASAMTVYEATSHDLQLLLVVIGIITLAVIAFQAGQQK
jgi:hypothetical protein